MRKYKIMSLLLAAAVAVTAVTACGGGSGNEYTRAGADSAVSDDSAGGASGSGGGLGGGSGQSGEDSGSGSGSGQPREASGSGIGGDRSGEASGSGAADGEIPLGRYVEEEVTLPDSASGWSYQTLLKGEGGRPELYLFTHVPAAESVRYICDGETWEMDSGWKDWYDEKLANGEVCAEPYKVTYGLDGNYYFIAWDEKDTRYRLYRAEGAGGVTELLSDAFLPKAGEEYGMIPCQIDVAGDGRILLHDSNMIYCYRPDGAMLFTMERLPGASDSSIGYIEGNEFVTLTEGCVTRYDLTDGKKVEDIACDETIIGNRYGEECELFGDGNGGIYLASAKGLFHVSRGGTLWEQIMDGKLNSMSRESRALADFCPGGDDDFFGCFINGTTQGFSVCHYTYDPQMPSVPRYTLSVYSLTENATIRQAASVFQEEHPDVFVDVRSATEEDGERAVISEDIIRALNTEILNGKGADVFVLDGLPADSYQAKGVLMDMRDLFAQIRAETPLLSQVVESFTEEDGSVYQMPARIQVPVALGTSDAVQAWQSLEGIRDYAGGKPLRWADVYEALLREVAVLYDYELFNGDGLDRDRMSVCLEAVKALGESCGAKESFTDQELGDLHISRTVPPRGTKGSGVFYDGGLADSGVESLTDISDFGLPEAFLRNHPETTMELVNGVYFPSCLIGINRVAADPELAGEFVKCIYSLDVQKENFHDGFPVSVGGLDAQFAVDSDGLFAGMGFENWDYTVSYSYPDEKSRAQLRALIEGVSQPVNVNQTLLGMVVSGAMDYLTDKISVDQAVSAIEQQVMLYLAERG